MSETETLDRLYLELSQFTTARTARELELERERDAVLVRAKEAEGLAQRAVVIATSGYCVEYTAHVASMSLREYLAEVEGKCFHCLERERDAARKDVEQLRGAIHDVCRSVEQLGEYTLEDVARELRAALGGEEGEG